MTPTGRFAHSQPEMQTLNPRRVQVHRLIETDFSAIEQRILATLSEKERQDFNEVKHGLPEARPPHLP